MISTRVEKHIIRESDPDFKMLDHFCFLAKNLYNHANYLIRKEYSDTGKWLRYVELDKLLKKDEVYPDYRKLPSAAAAQQLLRQLDNNWSAFFTAIRDWKLHPEKYQSKPEPPRYKKKLKGRTPIFLTNQNALLKDNQYIVLPKSFNRRKFDVRFPSRDDFIRFLQCRILPRGNHIVVEFVYSIEVPDLKPDNQRYFGIDIGVDNLAAVSNNVGLPFYLIDGKGLKSMNKYYNKLIAHYRSKLMKDGSKKTDDISSRRIKSITSRRNRKIDDYLHKASRWIVNFARDNDVNTIVVGKNDLWKKGCCLGKNNQTFVQIPHARFINMLIYKAEEYGISVIEREESYTSKTSFLDDEFPTKHEEYAGTRFQRGLFRSGNTVINADSNAGLQIIKKFNPDFKVEDMSQTILNLQKPIRLKVS